jgi:single-strand DNA-binding protein
LAVTRRFFDRNAGEKREETLFIDVTAWDKTAEFCKNYLHKGSGIFVEGRLKEDKWEDKQTGQNRSKITVVAERVQFADSKGSGAEGGGMGGGAEATGASVAPATRPAPVGRVSDGVETPGAAGAPGNTEDDLPF